tara:strand:- start:3 stop:830 length:828 start_codon:yes stop_codon:yes gene_type:complete
MNILEAYIEQLGFFFVVFTSVDYDLLKEIVFNLSNDFNAEFIDAYSILVNIEDVDHERLKELMSGRNLIKFIIAPVLPNKFTKIKTSFHINLSLNDTLISERGIKKNLVDMENKYKVDSMVNKYINVSKYKNKNKKLEDDIFDIIIGRINKKLDDGNYELKLNESRKKKFKNERLAPNIYEESEKEKYLEDKDEKFDENIYQQIDDSLIDDDEESYVSLSDVNMDDEIYPMNDFSNLDAFEVYNQDGGLNEITGTRILKKEFGISGSRIIKKKMK